MVFSQNLIIFSSLGFSYISFPLLLAIKVLTYLKLFLQVLERQNLRNQMNSKLNADDSKSKYIINSKKKKRKTLHQGDKFLSCYY